MAAKVHLQVVEVDPAELPLWSQLGLTWGMGRHEAEAAGTEVQEGTGAGVAAHTAPVAMALGPAAVLGGPGHVDNVGYQQPCQVILKVLAGLLGAEAGSGSAASAPRPSWELWAHTAELHLNCAAEKRAGAETRAH